MNDGVTAVSIQDVCVTFTRWGQRVAALDTVSLSIPAGQWLMLVGHNGSGKSTLLKAVCGQIRLEYGIIDLFGDRLGSLSARRLAEQVFLVHQDPLVGTAPALTVFENLLVADADAARSHAPRRQLHAEYHELLAPLGLASRLRQLVRYLSGGERQLLALLIARLRRSPVVLLDEPLAALDPGKAQLCLDLIKELNRSGRTVLQVTHDPDLALSCGHRTVVLRAGRVAFDQSGHSRAADDLRKAWTPDLPGEPSR